MKEISSNGLSPIIAQAIEEMKAEQGKNFSLEKINLAELERRTGVTRAKLRRLKENGFVDKPHALKGRKSKNTLLSGYTGIAVSGFPRDVHGGAILFGIFLEMITELGIHKGLLPCLPAFFTILHPEEFERDTAATEFFHYLLKIWHPASGCWFLLLWEEQGLQLSIRFLV